MSIAPLGALQSVAFMGVRPTGLDIYEVKFEHGTMRWSILLGPDGKILALAVPSRVTGANGRQVPLP